MKPLFSWTNLRAKLIKQADNLWYVPIWTPAFWVNLRTRVSLGVQQTVNNLVHKLWQKKINPIADLKNTPEDNTGKDKEGA